MSEVRLMFRQPGMLGADAALALEDYARVVSTVEAAVMTDAMGRVAGVALQSDGMTDSVSVGAEIERFFESLASDSHDRLGWR